MTTKTQISQARLRLQQLPPEWREKYIGAIPAPSTVSHQNYSVSYFADHSILIWSQHDGYTLLDSEQTYYRDTVEHLARCLGTFTKARRAEMVGGQDKWIDGIFWSADGEFICL